MTIADMIAQINLMMGESYADELVSAYISQAQRECLEREYCLIGKPVLEEGEEYNYSKYDNLVIDSVIVGLSVQGAEGENQHSENGILRGFNYSTMRDYIKAHLIPYSRVI